MRIVIKKPVNVEVQLDPDQYRAALRMEKYFSMPVSEQLARGHKDFLNYHGIHVTKRRSKRVRLMDVK